MKLYGRNGQYVELHISPETKNTDCWVCINHKVKNDFHEMSYNIESLQYEDVLRMIRQFRRYATVTDKYVKNNIECFYAENKDICNDRYLSAIKKYNEIKNLYNEKDFVLYDAGLNFIRPDIYMIQRDKNADKSLIRFYFVFIFDECLGYSYECFVDVYATNNELLKAAYELEIELCEYPYLTNPRIYIDEQNNVL